MVGNFDFSVIISQVPHVQKMQGDVQKGPFNLQQGLQREIDKKQDKVLKEIEASSRGGEFQKVGDEKKRKEGHRKDKHKKEKRENNEENRKLKNTTMGTFVDIKV